MGVLRPVGCTGVLTSAWIALLVLEIEVEPRLEISERTCAGMDDNGFV